PLIARIHHRMPVILRPQDEDAWLNSKTIDEKSVLPLLKTYEKRDLKAYRVSIRVNKAEFDSKDLIKPEGKKTDAIKDLRLPF
ncbi:MAG: SOS response-associated peptidase family protein, partial [Candidatus Falkowbacteria bacterium]